MTPPLPSLRALTRELRDLHEAFAHPIAGGEYVRLVCVVWEDFAHFREWRVTPCPEDYRIACLDAGARCVFGREYIPGDGAPFDAVAAARRLLAAARDGGAR